MLCYFFFLRVVMEKVPTYCVNVLFIAESHEIENVIHLIFVALQVLHVHRKDRPSFLSPY